MYASNPADLFTKILTKQPFEKHRKFVLNLAGDTGAELGKSLAQVERKTAADVVRGGDAGGSGAPGARAGPG